MGLCASAFSEVVNLLNESRECFVRVNNCNWSKSLQENKPEMLNPAVVANESVLTIEIACPVLKCDCLYC